MRCRAAFEFLVATSMLVTACSAPQREAGGPVGAPPGSSFDQDEDSSYVEMQRIAEGHAYVARLVCPSGAAAKSGPIATSVDARGRFIDAYQVTCPAGISATIVVQPLGPLPDPPKGFRLLDEDSWQAFREASALLQQDPSSVQVRLMPILKRYPDYVPALRLSALNHAQLDEPAAAVADFEAVVRGDPQPLYRLEHATSVKNAGNAKRYHELLVGLLGDVKKDWEHYPELQCRLGVERMNAGDAKGIDEMRAACDRKFEPCCDLVKALSKKEK